MRVSGSNVLRKSSASSHGTVLKYNPDEGLMPLSTLGADLDSQMREFRKAERTASTMTIENAERPTNFWYRVTGQTSYWHMYALMDWYDAECSILNTAKNRFVMELFKYGVEFVARFALKCEECGFESQTYTSKCPVCGSLHLRKPDETQKEYFKRPNGKSFIDEANDNGQSLSDVMKSYAESQFLNNQAYVICITGDIVDGEGNLVSAYPLEFMAEDPKFVRFLYDDTGKIGSRYAFTLDDRNSIVDFMEDEDLNIRFRDDRGRTLYPACWQVGNNLGGTGRYWLYTQEEVYQDHWYSQSLIYGIPTWLSIQDDLLTWHYIEKHNLKKYKYGYVRKIVILPGFSDEDVEDIIQGIQDILSTNDNSIPFVCTPPQLAGVAEMHAQTLELGAESSADLMQIKNDIRDRILAHAMVPNLFMGDITASGGMNNESQQITVFDRSLVDKFARCDRMCKWFLSWFPQITDWELAVIRPTKSYIDTKRRLDRIQEAQQMKALGFEIHYRDGEFWYSEQPMDQTVQKGSLEMQEEQMNAQRGMMPGDGEGPPERGSLRREDADVDESKNEVDQAMRESAGAAEV